MPSEKEKLLEEVQASRERFVRDIETVSDLEQVEQLRIRYLGRKGVIQRFFSQLGQLAKEDRPEAGKAINELKELVNRAISAAGSAFRL